MKTFFANKFLINKFSKQLVKLNHFNFARIVQLNLGDLGEGTKEATIRTWFKKEGDIVEEVKQ